MQTGHSYAFTMGGYMDVHSDTQFVRIMPIGDILMPSDSSDGGVQVTLKRVSTQETERLPHQLVRFGSTNYVRNYYTTSPVYPREAYEITATNRNGDISSAIITMPDSLAMPSVEYNTVMEDATITGVLSDQNELIYIEQYYKLVIYLEHGCVVREVTYNHTGEELRQNDTYRLRTRHIYDLGRFADVPSSSFDVIHRKLRLVSASASYPDLKGLTPEEMTLPHLLTNVSNGTGFVAGLADITIDITPETPTFCD